MLVKPVIFYLGFLIIPITFISSIVVPYLIATVIQEMVNHQYEVAQTTIWWIGGLMLAVIGLRWLWNHIFDLDGIIGCRYLHHLAFEHVMSQDYEFFTNQYTGALASYQQRLVSAYIDYNNLTLLAVPKIVTIIVGSVIALFFKSPLLGFITLVCVALISAVSIITARWRLTQRREVSYQNGRLAGQLSDSLSHAVTVKALAKEKDEVKRLGLYVEDWARAQYRLWESFIIGDGARTFFHTVMFVAILLGSLYLFRQGTIGIAAVTLVQLYTVRLLDTTVEIADTIKRNEVDMSDAYQMMLLLQRHPTVQDPSKPRELQAGEPVALDFQKVSFSYGSAAQDQAVIRNLSLSVKPGEKVGIVGPSGAGKTTLTKLILRFHDVQKGSIELNGIDVRELTQENLRSHIAYVPQEPLLFFRSIRENIAYSREGASAEEIEEVTLKANVTEFTQQLPEGLDTMVGERGIKLSGGQRQRVAIARAMLQKAPLLVLDEATSALDSETESLIQDALWKLMEDKTTLVIAHRLSTIRRMDRIVVVENGTIIEEGPHESLLKKDGLYARLWKHQSGGFIGGA